MGDAFRMSSEISDDAPPAQEADHAPAAPRYAGHLFAYVTGEGTADGQQVCFALSRGNDPLRQRELNGAVEYHRLLRAYP